jgi:hypothetical protein
LSGFFKGTLPAPVSIPIFFPVNILRQAGHMIEEICLWEKDWLNMKQVFFGTIRVFLLFAGCTVLFYYGIMWINQEYENYRRYDEPKDTAVKAFQPIQTERNDWFARLLLFYQNGE